MTAINFYARAFVAYLWFLAACLTAILLLPFRWRDPSMGSVFAKILWPIGHRILGVHVIVENEDRLHTNQPCIYVANHQSNLDIFTMARFYPPRTVIIGKKELKWVPLFGLFFYGAGNIMIDRKNRVRSVAGLDAAEQAIVEHRLSVWVFPEGTRNRGATQMLPFKKGAFYMAINAQVPLVPIAHQHLFSYFDYAKKSLHGGEIRIKVLEPVVTKGKTVADLPQLMAETRARIEAALSQPEMRAPEDLA